MQKPNAPPPPGFMAPPPYSQAPPPAYGAPPNIPQATPNVVIMQAVSLGPEPQHLTCPNCHSSVTTRVETEATTKTHLFALLLCLLQCYPFACCPYCIDSCLAKRHYCPSCNAFLGEYDA